jgi:hypothetical protein
MRLGTAHHVGFVASYLLFMGTTMHAAAADVIIVDNDNANNANGTFSVLPGDPWSTAGLPDYVGQWMADYAWKDTDDPSGFAEWRPNIPAAGSYEVAVWFRSTGSGRPNNARYTVTHATGSVDVIVNQQVNGSQWVVLGTYGFNAGTTGNVTLSSAAQSGKTIIADAVRFRATNMTQPAQLAGMRVSRIPFSPFPEPEFFIDTARCMTTKVADAAPGLIWIVSLYWGDGEIGLNFPNPTGQSYPFMNFSGTDKNEAHLDAFDAAGIDVWMQVEPGDANVEDLIDIMVAAYGHHPCIVGFGVDVEWHNPTVVSTGRAVTDVEAQTWLTRIKSYNPTYRMFLKHYAQNRMPPTLRSDILFVDDSQGFPSLNSMVNEFASWGNQFSPAAVGFQYGYPNDRPWWSTFDDPAGMLASTLDAAIPNTEAFFWVDFTIEEIAPVGDAPTITQHPADKNVFLQATTHFSVMASDSGVLSYAWERNGIPLVESLSFSGVATPTLSITAVDLNVAGAYRCVVTTGCGSTTSDTAELTVLAPGDYDNDGDVDHTDMQMFFSCLAGPTSAYRTGHFCLQGDADADRDIDLRDFGVIQRIFASPQ